MNEPDRKTKTNEITSDMLVFREDANFHPPKSGSKNEALAPSKHQREGTLSQFRVSIWSKTDRNLWDQSFRGVFGIVCGALTPLRNPNLASIRLKNPGNKREPRGGLQVPRVVETIGTRVAMRWWKRFVTNHQGK